MKNVFYIQLGSQNKVSIVLRQVKIFSQVMHIEAETHNIKLQNIQFNSMPFNILFVNLFITG